MMKSVREIDRKRLQKLFKEGMKTAERYDAITITESVVVLQWIIDEEIKKHETELMNEKCKVLNRDTEITKLNELVDKLIAENTELKTYIEEMHCKWN